MVASKSDTYISPEDYLAGEKVSLIKHEYRQGEIYAMAGTSKAHAIISLNAAILLRNHLRGSGCIPYMADIKVRIEAANCYYYPDVAVSCDERDKNADEDFITYPRLIVEVLSPSTAAFDRGEKFADYRTSESLQEYVLINQEKVSVECFRRNAEGLWVLYPYSQGQDVQFASVNFSCAIEALYEDAIPSLVNYS
ncbi:Uma2 family endonuclease [Microcoleus sp. LEGE 07076]|uniref:Uma2 family endonuclease n=1 Tax=Microcoleus sp. LEGE 07076 TaxID=915322 RepID=UPI001882F223|nr:Uma2 family endonuclease [Microcoleus sp. LEGE 07076]MBE9186998.1 Uma2 family endonuclease [Microcoleus sp. LEGE 07076]